MSEADEEYLDRVLADREGNHLEFKRAENTFNSKDAIDYCAALANEGGGMLILGVTNSIPRTVVGSAAFRGIEEIEFKVYEKLKIKVVVRELSYHGHRVVVFQIPGRRRGQPVEHDGRYLMRAGESLVPMSVHRIGEVLEETKIRRELLPITDDLTPHEVAIALDLDGYFAVMPDTRPPSLSEELEVLQRQQMIDEGAVVGTWRINSLGALCIARNLDDFPDLRLRRIRFIRYSGSDRVDATYEQFDRRGYLLAFEDIVKLVGSYTPSREVIDGGRRTTIPAFPPVAVREFLANALVHQDLAEDSVQLTIELFNDRLEIRNPGNPIIKVQRFVDETRARNPQLAELMRLAGICEIRGSGVDRALAEIEDFTQPAPRFNVETGATVVTLSEHMDFMDMTVEERVWATFLHCCVKYEKSERLTNSSLRTRFGLKDSAITLVSQAISSAIDVGLIKRDPRAGSSRRFTKYVPFFA